MLNSWKWVAFFVLFFLIELQNAYDPGIIYDFDWHERIQMNVLNKILERKKLSCSFNNSI